MTPPATGARAAGRKLPAGGSSPGEVARGEVARGEAAPGEVALAEVAPGGAAPGEVAPVAALYERLAELAERELRCAETGDLDALAESQASRAELTASLPPQAPPAARAALERAAAAQRRTAALLETAHAEVGAELRHLARGRAAARSYAPAGVPAAPALDRPA